MSIPTREEMAIAIIKQRPGITPIRLAICLDMQVYETREGGKRAGGRRGMNRRVTRFIDSLERRGVVIKRRDPFATKANDYKIYPAGWEFPEKELFKPAKDAARYQCRTYRVPVETIHQYIPEKSTMSSNQSAYDRHLSKVRGVSTPAPVPTPTPAPHQKRQGESITQKKLSKALDELIAIGKPFSMAQVERRAGYTSSIIHQWPELRDKARDAIARINSAANRITALDCAAASAQRSAVQAEKDIDEAIASLSELPTEPAEATPDEVSILKAEIERLRAEIDRLQQESDPADQIIQEMSDRATYVEWLQSEELKWRLTARRYAEELAQTQQDLDSAIANAEACSRLLSLATGEPAATYANGHRELLEEVGE